MTKIWEIREENRAGAYLCRWHPKVNDVCHIPTILKKRLRRFLVYFYLESKMVTFVTRVGQLSPCNLQKVIPMCADRNRNMYVPFLT